MMDLADAEAACLGNLALTCMRRGSIPRIRLTPLWFTNRGRCIGLRIIGHDEDEFDLYGDHDGSDYLAPLRPIVQHLKAYAGEIISTEGTEWLLHEWETVRDIYYEMYPVEAVEWVDLQQAMDIAGRKRRTIQTWAMTGWIREINTPGKETLYAVEDLKTIRDNIKMGPKRKLESLPLGV